MKQVVVPLLLTLCVTGCVTSNYVTREWTLEKSNQYAEINEQGREGHATITVEVDSVTTVYEGDSVTIRLDSVQWTDSGAQLAHSVAIANLRRIRFTRSRFIVGTALGAIPGTLFFILSVGHSGSNSRTGADWAPVGLGIAVGGALIGAGIDLLAGHKTDYIFPDP